MIFEEPSIQDVRARLESMVGRRILVVGDAMLDRYIYGTSSRISPEAPVQIVQAEREENLLGGAANVAKCLVALGANVTLCCVVGDDALAGQFLSEAKNLRIDTRFVFRESCRPTTVKTRIVCGRQHILRVDRESLSPYPQALAEKLCASVREAAASAEAVLLSDYDKGVLCEPVCVAAIRAAERKPILVDPKGLRWDRYRGATVVKPNFKEALAFLGSRDSCVLTSKPAAAEDCEAMADQLRRGLHVKNVLLTRSEHGMSLASEHGQRVSFGARAKKVEDEAGAGDVAAAVTLLSLSAGAALPEAAWLGNVAAAAKVGKFGTHTVSDHDILEALGERAEKSQRKIMTASEASAFAAQCRRAGKKVVFTNGCFDVLHLGHVVYLQDARAQGGVLIVGINSDASVRRLKGPERPWNNENDRCGVISAMSCVDAVVVFGEDTPAELIKAVRPDVLCKGGDYKGKEQVVGWEIVEAYGGRVTVLDLVEGRSSTKTIGRMKSTGASGL